VGQKPEKQKTKTEPNGQNGQSGQNGQNGMGSKVMQWLLSNFQIHGGESVIGDDADVCC